MFKVFGQTLDQRGLPLEQQSIVDEVKAKEVIAYHQTEDPVKVVLDIVNMVAMDPPNAMVTRVIGSFIKPSFLRR